MGNSKAFMLPGGPLLPSILPFRFIPRGKTRFPIVASLWQSSDIVKKFYRDFLRLDALRGLTILVSVGFGPVALSSTCFAFHGWRK